MKLSDSPAVEILRLERVSVQQRLSLASMPSATVTVDGMHLGSAELGYAAREAVAGACRLVLGRIDGDLRGLGVDIDI